MFYENMATGSAWMLVWFRKLGKKNKVGEKIRVFGCLEKRDSGTGIYFCID